MRLTGTMWVGVLLASFSIVGAISREAAADTIMTGFEEFFPNTAVGAPFDIGTSPERASFGGGAFAGMSNNPELYFKGQRAWMVLPGNTGSINFDTNAAEVDFFARTHSSATGSTVITAFDNADNVIDMVTLTAPDPFQPISFRGNISRIEVVNNDMSWLNAVDAFTFVPVPEPSTFMLGLLGLAALIGYRYMNRRWR